MTVKSGTAGEVVAAMIKRMEMAGPEGWATEIEPDGTQKT